MKKIFLLIANAVMVLSAAAQERSIVLVDYNKAGKEGMDQWAPSLRSFKYAKSQVGTSTNTSVAKTSDFASGEWFCFADASAVAGTAEYATWPVYPDSNITTGNFNWYLHGFGISFDPRSYKFSQNGFINTQPVFLPPSFPIDATTYYKVDSIEIAGWYQRVNDTVVDTLDIYIGYATYPAGSTPGAYPTSWSFTGPVDTLWGRQDSSLQAVQPVYDHVKNGLDQDTIPNMIKITKILDASAFADSVLHPTSDSNFLHVWRFALPGGGICVPGGGSVFAFAVFRSAVQHPLGTDWNGVNMWQQWTAAVNGSNGIPDQDINDFNTGLAAFTEERYHMGNYWELNDNTIGHHPTLAATYTSVHVFIADPWIAFHLVDGCPSGIKGITSLVSDVKAHPSPAGNDVNITFTSLAAGKATISITNAMGQVVDSRVLSTEANEVNTVTFSTATFASGIYFYTVEANGQRHTSRFAVAH